MQHRVATVAIILDEMDVVLFEVHALLRQYTVENSDNCKNTAVWNPEDGDRTFTHTLVRLFTYLRNCMGRGVTSQKAVRHKCNKIRYS
jgi:hypothetical protein